MKNKKKTTSMPYIQYKISFLSRPRHLMGINRFHSKASTNIS